MRRRTLLALTGAAAGLVVFQARAQKVPTVGFLIAGDPEPRWTQFRKAMADLGYIDGRTVKYEYRAAGADAGSLDGLAASLVSLKVDVIVAVLSQAIAAAERATPTIPIVFNGAAPSTGMVKNVARPEGNMTGAYSPTAVLAGKSVQLFREVVPAPKAIGVLINVPDPFHVPLLREIEIAGRAEKIDIVPAMVNAPAELAAAYDMLARRGVDGVLVQPSLGMAEPAQLALKHRMPSISYRREFADAGGLLSYGADQMENDRNVASYVDRILKGARPADLPALQSSRFELVINQKTAKALGLVLSPMLLARADEVIE